MNIEPVISSTEAREAYKKASEATQKTFSSDETLATVLKLRESFPLFSSDLGKEVGYLILGLTTITQFRSRLMQVASDEKAVSSIIEVVTKEILMPMRSPAPKIDLKPTPLPVRNVVATKAAPKVVVEIPRAQPPVRRIPSPVVPSQKLPPVPPVSGMLQKNIVPPPIEKRIPALPEIPAKKILIPMHPQVSVPPVKTPVAPAVKPPLQKPITPQVPLSSPPVRPRIVIGPHKMRTMEHDAATAKGHPGVVIREADKSAARPALWEAASNKPTTPVQEVVARPEPTAPEQPKAAVDPYREPIG